MVLTKEGHFQIESLVGKTVEVWDRNQWVTVDNFRVTGIDQPVFSVMLQSGQDIVATPYHSFVLEDGSRKTTSELLPGDKLLTHDIMIDINLNVGWNKVKSVTFSHIADKVYCCTVPTNHQFALTNGIILGQCGEIVLQDNFCNLSEVHLNILDPLDLKAQRKAFEAAGLSVAVLLNHKFTDPRYQASREVDPIVGVSFTGLFDFFVQAFGIEWLEWWQDGRPDQWGIIDIHGVRQSKAFKEREKEYLEMWKIWATDSVHDYCRKHGLKVPNRCTAVQPAGSKSLLTGASCGFHPPKAAQYIRRITFAKNDPVALACIDYGYTVLPSQSDKDLNGNLLDDPHSDLCTEWLVEIPVSVSWAGLPGIDRIDIGKFSALAQFDFAMQVQNYYVTHNLSATIELREDEITHLATAIYNNIQSDGGYISAALLARFDSLQTFPRMPFEPINRDTYLHLSEQVLGRRTRDFKEALDYYDSLDSSSAESLSGAAGCDGDKCLMPEVKG
jgi:ribonucleotide reductase class II